MKLLVDTCVWSLTLRRDTPRDVLAVDRLVEALGGGETVYSTGLILQELLQGCAGSKARDQIVERFPALPFLVPDRQDHIDAAELRNECRRAGVQIGTIGALLARLCLRHDLELLTTDLDFNHVAGRTKLRIWRPRR